MTRPLTLRGLLLLLFALGASGAGVDLLLIGHFDGLSQLAPLIIIACGLAAAAWCAVKTARASLQVFQLMMLAFIVGGAVGLWLHYRANVEFALELSPARAGIDLFWAAIQGASPPSVAPGTLIHLGLIGLAYTYRHPLLDSRPRAVGISGDER